MKKPAFEMRDPYRGTGRTTNQIKHAPQGAFFVWINASTDYPRQLAKQLGRDDLRIVSPNWLVFEQWRGMRLSGIIVDHAALDRFTYAQWRALNKARTRIF